MRISSVAAKGVMGSPDDDNKTPFEEYRKSPDKYRLAVNDPDAGPSGEGWNGQSGWTQDPDAGLREMTKKELALERLDRDFHREMDLKALYPTMTAAGKDTVGGRAVWAIEATPVDGPAEKLLFDAETGLLARRDYERVNMDSGILLYQVFFEDYRKVDGVAMPFRVRQTSTDGENIVEYSEIKANVAIEDGKFEKPAK